MGNQVCFFEIGCKDLAANKAFYGSLFDWKLADHGNSTMIDTGEKSGINGHINSLGHEPHQYILFYVLVDDIPKYLAKAVSLGGKQIVPQVEVPNMGWFAWFSDPGGNMIGLWKPMQA